MCSSHSDINCHRHQLTPISQVYGKSWELEEHHQERQDSKHVLLTTIDQVVLNNHKTTKAFA